MTSEATIPVWQQRVIDEKRELDKRLAKLRSFLYDPDNGRPSEDRKLLLMQEQAMADYSSVLAMRISAWGVA